MATEAMKDLKRVRCKKNVRWSSIYQGGHARQCKRYAVKDGYCKVHHPDEEFRRGQQRAEKTPLKFLKMLS